MSRPPTSRFRRRPREAAKSPAAWQPLGRVQSERYEGSGVRTNAEADGELLDRVATPDEPGRKLLADAAAAMRLSARGFHRVIRVARTIADLAGADVVGRIPYRRSPQLSPAGAPKLKNCNRGLVR